MLGESWSSKESLKILRFGGVGLEGLMRNVFNVSSFMMSEMVSLLLIMSFILLWFLLSKDRSLYTE